VLNDAVLSDCTLRGAVLARTVWDRARLQRLDFRGSDFLYARLVHVTGDKVCFDDCSMVRADFHAAAWTRTSFTGADLKDSHGTDPELAAAEKRSIELEPA